MTAASSSRMPDLTGGGGGTFEGLFISTPPPLPADFLNDSQDGTNDGWM